MSPFCATLPCVDRGRPRPLGWLPRPFLASHTHLALEQRSLRNNTRVRDNTALRFGRDSRGTSKRQMDEIQPTLRQARSHNSFPNGNPRWQRPNSFPNGDALLLFHSTQTANSVSRMHRAVWPNQLQALHSFSALGGSGHSGPSSSGKLTLSNFARRRHSLQTAIASNPPST